MEHVEQEANVNDNLVGAIDIAVANYLDGKGDIGGIACHAIVHSLKTGDCSPIQRLYQALPAESREQKKFKTFLGYASRYTHENGETVACFAFKEGKLSVRKGTHNLRVGMWDSAQELYDALGNFLDFAPPKKTVDPNIEKLLKMVKSALTKAKDKAAEFGSPIPKGIDQEMIKLKDMIEVVLPQVKGVANVKLDPAEAF